MNVLRNFISVLGVSIFLISCAPTKKSIVEDYNAGKDVVAKTYAVDKETAWIAAKTYMEQNNPNDFSEDKAAGQLLGVVGSDSIWKQSAAAGFLGPILGSMTVDYGSRVGIFIKDSGDRETTISVISQNMAASTGHSQTGPKADDVHEGIKKILDDMAKGLPVTDKSPASVK